ncbi:TrbI/VirB10 family protein [Caulobacter hibisci]|uniref:TrbI/VirB10 family protein n=1 Tax=Caulobacter hibisci TaxID=2035993 RepID=A0ABS0T2T2_9CAUL|nr:TrbI/VirB10 family protein [Caulobacter hibisci]MBI1685162.1 TrbI/VirB10 family protein [Caulobacter hibisci]
MSEPGQDPVEEVVSLRAPPPRVARLSRPMVMALGGLGAAVIGGALVLALQTRAPKPVEHKIEEPETKPPLAALSEAPKTYSEVPKLGPPLPGDLGRPILAAQERQAAGAAAPVPAAPVDAQAEARRQVRDAARTSAVFLPGVRAAARASASEAVSLPIVSPLSAPTATLMPAAAPQAQAQTGQTAKRAFLDGQGAAAPTVSSFRPVAPAGRLLLQAHTVITAALLSAVSSDLPGPVSAQVTRHVYDSLTGRTVLIPQGSKLLGTYDTQIAFGQKRVLLAWERIVFPDGRTLQLDRLAGADAAGRSGLKDGVDDHWGSVAKAAVLSSVLGVGAELATDNEDAVARALSGGVQDTVNQAGQQIVRRQLDVQPSLTLRAGLPMTILVTRDIVFDAEPARP